MTDTATTTPQHASEPHPNPTLIAREYALDLPNFRQVIITRYDTKGKLIAGGGWVARRGDFFVSETNPDWGYLNDPDAMLWLYKVGTIFGSAQGAASAAMRAEEPIVKARR